MASEWDVIVLGLGGVGSAALMHAASRGLRVLGVEQFGRAHDRGSSHGQTRVIRQAYFEHPDYVPLLREAYRLWDELSVLQQETLFHRTGLLEVGPPDGVVVPGVLESARRHGLVVEQLDPREARQRFPGFQIDDDQAVVFESDAGYLFVERCVLAHLAQAEQRGAKLLVDEPVLSWRAEGDSIQVETRSGVHHAARLIITAGPWSAHVLNDLGLPLQVRRKHLHWFAAGDASYDVERGAPVFFYEVGSHFFYGFPQIDSRGVKVAEHSGGERVARPEEASRDVDLDDRASVSGFLERYLPSVEHHRPLGHAVCFYTMSPDEHFIVDRHPEHSQVVFAAGLSGHGFKFTSVLGQVLVELAVDRTTKLPIDFLSWTPSRARPEHGRA